jgi:hypothetical protein
VLPDLSADGERDAPLGFALDDEALGADGELIALARIDNLARSHLEDSRFGMNAGLTEANDCVGTTGDDAHADRLAARRGVHRVDPEGGEGGVHRPGEHRHQVRLPLISTRGRVQIGKGFDCTCSMTQRVRTAGRRPT